MKLPGRVVRATLIAPLVVPLLYLTVTFALILADPVLRGEHHPSGVVVLFALAAPVAYAATLGLALPALWLLRRFWRLTLASTVAVGLIVGFGVVIVFYPPEPGAFIRIWLPPWLGALLGGTSAAVWWRLAAIHAVNG
jgi:hypothetical protein